MPWVDPMAPVAILTKCINVAPYISFLGTCFAFRQTNHFLTAAHCIEGISEAEVKVILSTGKDILQAESIIKHPTADIAIIRTSNDQLPPIWAYSSYNEQYYAGTDFMALGFPEEVLS